MTSILHSGDYELRSLSVVQDFLTIHQSNDRYYILQAYYPWDIQSLFISWYRNSNISLVINVFSKLPI